MKTLDLHIIDIVHNSIRAKATEIIIEMVDSEKQDLLSLKIVDNGCGMPKEMMDAINETFYSSRPERKIGMGIALLKFHSELCNGKFHLTSEVGKGTEIYADYQRSHIDLQPKGDLAGCFSNFICQYQDINFIIRYTTDDDYFELSTADVKEVFEGMNLNDVNIINNLKELIAENINPSEKK
ncbi:MAG: sensor histidine kinase [Bacteroidales bacterium]|nr:sensor histidine kinase [Bacteroidales bacterium]